jgi:hypothetical protein
MLLSYDEIFSLARNGKCNEAEQAIRDRFAKTNLNQKQISGFMSEAYDRGHSYGHYEVILHAMTYLSIIENNYF